MEIEIKGYKVLIDDEDYDKVAKYNWSIDIQNRREGLKYVTHSIWQGSDKGYVTIKLHRLIMGCSIGDGMIVDHINHNTLDNRKCNLRVCKLGQNSMNRKTSKNSTTGYKGVWKRRDSGRYRVMLRNKGKRFNGGHYDSLEEAARAYDRLALKIFGEFAHTNFPKEEYTKELQGEQKTEN